MELILIRHGTTQGNLEKRFVGVLDVPLAPQGEELARRIYDRHRLLTIWLTALGVSPETAAQDACRIEHDISEETFERLKAHIQAHRS